MDMIFFFGASALYGIAMALFAVYAMTRHEGLSRVANGSAVAGVLSHAIFLILRTATAHHLPDHTWYVPWSGWFESFSFFAFVMAVQFVVIERRRMPILGAFVLPIIFAWTVVALFAPEGTAIPTLPRGLESLWLAAHIPAMFISYAAFGHAFALALAYLLHARQLKSKHPSQIAFRLPSLEELDRLIFRVIAWGFPVLTIGLLLGAQWAHASWGRYWSWDPKEIGAAVTWLVYAFYFAARFAADWRGRKAAYVSLAGFAVVLVTYMGVSHFYPGGPR